ncbi:MAG: VWA domain-containing protein [Pyrinomonadaceae bacterium]
MANFYKEPKRKFFRKRLSLVALLAFITFGFVVRTPAQDDGNVIRIDTELAVFEVLVEDKAGKPVHGLRADDFRVYENGKERRIDFFQPVISTGNNRPMMVVFAVDVSGSMTNAEIAKLRKAIDGFIDRFGDYRSYFSLVSFAMNVKTIQKFTNRPEEVRKALSKLDRDQDGRSTHAFDAVDLAVRQIDRSSPKSLDGQVPKRAVILITDGFPVGDTVSASTVTERANRSGTSVYAIILPSFSPIQRDSKPLMTLLEASGLIEKTGGSTLYAVNDNMEPLFSKLAEEISASYAIAFYPMEKSDVENEKRTVTIESKNGYRIKQNRKTYELRK